MASVCGIFGFVGEVEQPSKVVKVLAKHAKQRGQDSSGLAWIDQQNRLTIRRADYSIDRLLRSANLGKSRVVFGHSRLITNGMSDNQPVLFEDIVVIHNGIVVNTDSVWKKIGLAPRLEVDTEVIAAVAFSYLTKHGSISGVSKEIVELCKGSMSCVVFSPKTAELVLFSNNGSLYSSQTDKAVVFSSESHPLMAISDGTPAQIFEEVLLQTPEIEAVNVADDKVVRGDFIPKFQFMESEFKLLKHDRPNLIRCNRCILPHTMPYIEFDSEGVCNFCKHYKIRNSPKPVGEIEKLLGPYRRQKGTEAIMPFSGGRDSSYALHLAVKELNLKVLAYTYDWGMVTDLGRRNISRMCAVLGVENIVVAADIDKKRRYIRKNLNAWLAKPHLGMISLLTAGDKHFYKYVERVKDQNNVSLNLWGVNPLETTHFKAGFLGVSPDFDGTKVYRTGLQAQVEYQKLRFKEMAKNPKYVNSSLLDTLSGEYYRSIAPKTDYFHIFDYWKWDENQINRTLIEDYDWELATDTSTTWRIGDGTAAFYNYVYFTVAGFSEHDTFRSNQIREGDITREEALRLVEEENQPRYENLKWYLDAVGVDFETAVRTVNAIPKLWEAN